MTTFHAYAQTCGGSATCTTNTSADYAFPDANVDPSTGQPYPFTCHSCVGTIQDETATCTIYNASRLACLSCVTQDQTCSQGPAYAQDASCAQYVTILSLPQANYFCGNTEQRGCFTGCVTYCWNTPKNFSFCGGGFEPPNTCGTTTGSQTYQYTGTQTCTPQTQTQQCPQPYNNCSASANYTCTNGNACTTNIFVNVYKDYNHNGVKDGNDAGIQGITISDNGGNTPTTNSSGSVTFSGKTTNTYNITMTVPAGYEVTNGGTAGPKGPTTYTQQVILSNNAGNQTVNFYLTPVYSISGTIFNDLNLNGVYDNGTESPFTQSTTIHVSGGPTNVSDMTQSTGIYATPQNLLSGQYSVSLSANTLPSGYRSSGPTSWIVTVGDPAGSPACSAGASTQATCGNPNNGSISNLDFGVSNETTWIQPICGDDRVDAGYSQAIPSTADCGGTSTPYAITSSTNPNLCPNIPGILYSGNVDPTYGKGLGSSTANMSVGNSLFPELFKDRIPNTSETSYSFVMTTLNNLATPPTPLTSICPSLNNCVLSETTPGGVYTTQASDGPVSISVSNTDATTNLGSANYTFVIGGNLTFTSNVTLQSGYSAAFISGGNIDVVSNVGESNWNSVSPDLEGFFSADGNFVLDSAASGENVCQANGQPLDKKLNVVGSVITDAAGTGGSLINNRLGCVQNLSCPTMTIASDPLQILHAPGTLRPGYTFWQELNP